MTLTNLLLKTYTLRKRLLAHIPHPIYELLRHGWDTLGILLIGYILLNVVITITIYFVSGQAVIDIALLLTGTCQATPRSCEFTTLYTAFSAWIISGICLLITLGFIVWRWNYKSPVTHDDLAAGIATIQYTLDEDIKPHIEGL